MLKQIVAPWTKRLEPWAAKIPIAPNAITLASLLFAGGGALATIMGYALFGAFLLFLMAFGADVLDGLIARGRRETSARGAFLDGVLDRCVEFLMLLAFWAVFRTDAALTLAIFSILFFGTGMTSFVKAYASHRGLLKVEAAACLPTILGRPERSMLLLLAFGTVMLGGLDIAADLIFLTALLSMVTAAGLTWEAWKKSSKSASR